MAQIKLNLQLIKQVISFVMTAGNVFMQVIETIERSMQNG